MLNALLEHLLEKSNQYQDEMIVFLHGEFDILLMTSTICQHPDHTYKRVVGLGSFLQRLTEDVRQNC